MQPIRAALFSLFALAATAYGAIEDGLVLHFTFDDVEGDKVLDRSPSKVVGRIEGKAARTAAVRGMGIALNANAAEADPGVDFVRAGNPPAANVQKAFTVAVWGKAANFGAYRTLASKTDGGAYALTVENGVTTGWIHVNGDYLHPVGRQPLATGRWYHFALTFDGQDGVLYVDGEEDGRGTRKGAITPTQADLMIGAEPAGQNIDPSWPAWHGVLDEFVLYSRALGKGEIHTLMAEALAVRPQDRLVTFWARAKQQHGTRLR
jgi:hypothetical protein